MAHYAPSPTVDSIEAFAFFCKEFFASQPWRHCINDLVFWICKKANPYGCPGVFKGNRDKPGRAVKLLIKGLAQIYAPDNRRGRFMFPIDEERYVEITKRDLLRIAGGAITPAEYDYAIHCLLAMGVVHRKLISVYGRGRILKLRLDMFRLQDLIKNIYELKYKNPYLPEVVPPPLPVSEATTIDKPLENQGSGKGGTENATLSVNRKCNSTVNAIAPLDDQIDHHLASGNLDSGNPEDANRVSHLSSGGELSAQPERSPSREEKEWPGADASWTGACKLDRDGESIVGEFRAFAGEPLTQGQVSKIQSLRGAPGHLEMTFTRVVGALHTLANSPFELPWAKGMSVDQLLDRRTWSRLARYADSMQFKDWEMTEYDLQHGQEEWREHLNELLDLVLSDPDKFKANVEYRKKRDKSTDWPALCLLGYVWQDRSVKMEMTKKFGRESMLNNPLYFRYTKDLVDWVTILQLQPEQVEKIEAAADAKLRNMRWYVAQGRKYA